ncbi:hypothetical protein CHS0354_003330 [Potamilus streckersoni]|uniref:AP-5 complex subunit sigma-1 n=1 Tax=Potamilus streckersoni TaxID=2493646 RepID=A0AAE0VQH6_9BIVA|nr:hypothetical protein CHS0354_003330 [Potamilus streckersoni]
MVYAFIIHTLLPGPCRVLFYQMYGQDDECDSKNELQRTSELKATRKAQIEQVASQVHSEYQFRRAVANRTVEEDIQTLANDDTLPEFELGFIRLLEGEPFEQTRIAVWLGAGNTGFTLVCHETENRVLAENILKLIIRCLQEHVRILSQPAETFLKVDKVCLVLSRFLPEGSLLFMNHRVIRGLEKELETLIKN